MGIRRQLPSVQHRPRRSRREGIGRHRQLDRMPLLLRPRRRVAEHMPEYVIHAIDGNDFDAFEPFKDRLPVFLRDQNRIGSRLEGGLDFGDHAADRFHRAVNADFPVIASLLSTGWPVIAEAIATAIATPAEGPSTGVPPGKLT